jgi:hypothetical protein
MYSRRAAVLKWVIPLGVLALLGLLFPQWTWNALLWLNDFLRLCYLFSFIVGYLCARFCIFQRADRRLAGWKSGIRIAAVLIVLIGCIALRVRLATVDSYVALDFILAALFSYCVLKAGAHLPHLTKFFAWFGARSTYMWLTHLFFFGPAFDAVTWLFRQSTWNYLTIMILSTLTAVLLEWLEKGIRAGGHRLMSCKSK